jgi:hypothetical protein
MNFINLTPHDIDIELENGTRVTIPKSGTVARVTQESFPIDGCEIEIDDEWLLIPVSHPVYGEVEGLPPVDPENPHLIYLVSAMVANTPAASARLDVYAPDTGPTAIREDGRIVAVRGLVQY